MKEKIDQLVLAIDCGTGGIRAILFDAQGNERASTKAVFTGYYSLEDNFKEAAPEMFWDGLVSVVHQMKEECPTEFVKIAALTIACQRDVITVVDENGKPLRDFISWLDRRELEKPLSFSWPYALLFKLIGYTEAANAFSQTCHAHWIKVYEPEIWAKAHKLVFLSTYLINRLSGRIVESRSSVAGHVPFDTKKKEWCKNTDVKAAILNIEADMRFDLVDSCQVIGFLTEEVTKELGFEKPCRVITSGTDKGCETLGIGALTPEIASVSLGTQATLEVTTNRYVEIYPFYPSFPAVSNEGYNPEVTIYHGFWMVDWFIENFLSDQKEAQVFTLLDQFLKETRPGAGGIIHQPYWGHEAFHPEARGALIGMTEGHDRRHIYRAIIEGLGFALLAGIELIEKKTKVPITEIGISGGGSISDEIMQIMANIFNRPVYRVQTRETTGLGASMAAFVGLGVYQTLADATAAMVRKKEIFYSDANINALYGKIYHEVYQKMYGRLKPLYKLLKI
ncbi:FGGY-family carbohydrate kinase [Eubacteriaceae bacterium ES2]|nr:FGGY-family carbohydrate kinase [Eubacteriaceae bacterium ES2]